MSTERHIGFTGTRFGMTNRQKETVRLLFEREGSFVFHHGDCIGADAEAHDLACAVGARVIIHPPIKDDLRAFKSESEQRTPKSYFERNRDIVHESHLLIATPFAFDETQGGTWYTINYARKCQAKGDPITVIIVYPSGTTKIEGPDTK